MREKYSGRLGTFLCSICLVCSLAACGAPDRTVLEPETSKPDLSAQEAPEADVDIMDGMSLGSAAAFMITGPATKITNLGAVKIVLGIRRFAFYLAYVMAFSLLAGLMVNLLSADIPVKG